MPDPFEKPPSQIRDFAALDENNILGFDFSELPYDDRIKFRERLQEIRRKMGMSFAYTLDLWPEHWLEMFLKDNEGQLKVDEMLFQEKHQYLRELLRENDRKKIDEFYAHWDEDVDGLEELRRESLEKAQDPVTNSPSKYGLSGDNNLNCGRKYDPRIELFWKDAEKLTDCERKFVDFVRSFGEDSVVVDLGCGFGSGLVRMLVELGMLKPENRINIDLDPRNIEHLNKVAHSGRNIVADAAKTKLPDQSADLVVFHMVLADNYLTTKKRKEIKAEIERILKPGGYLFGRTGMLDKDMAESFEKVDIEGQDVYRKK